MILEIIEPYIEVINLVLALVIVLYSVKIFSSVQGDLKKVWKYFLISILLFGLHEVFGSLAEFGIFEIEGLYALTEFFYIVGICIFIFAFKHLLGGISGGKKK